MRRWSRSRQIAVGEADVVLAGGVESMSRAPWVLPKTERPYPAGDATLVSTTLGWRLVNKQMRPEWTVSLGEATEQLREREKVDRESQDEFALRSHQAAAAAWDTGFYDDLTVAVPGVELARDESIRATTSLEKLAELKPSFRPDGTVTAGNASPLNDGASGVLLGNASAAEHAGIEPGGPDRRTRRRQPSTRSSSASHPSRQPTWPWAGRASAGPTSGRSSSTRRSPHSRSPASALGTSTPRS